MKLMAWAPAMVFGIGTLFTVAIDSQRDMQLEQPIAEAVDGTLPGFEGQDIEISEAEVRVAGVSSYLFREFVAEDSTSYSIYVGYYESQTRGKTIHSPRNCLPGSGWEALTSSAHSVPMDGEQQVVNQYLIRNGSQQALVLYWYQGRGRIESNEFKVKINLLMDSALRRRSEEALVRIVVPVGEGGTDAALQMATRVASRVAPELRSALPD